MPYRNLLTVAVTLGVLTACGGSDNNDSNANNAADPRPAISAAGSSAPTSPSSRGPWLVQTNTNNNNSNNNNGGNNNGGNNNSGNNNGSNNDTSNLKSYEVIPVGGQNVRILLPGAQADIGGFYEPDVIDSYKRLIGMDLQYVRYGVIADTRPNGRVVGFANPANEAANNMQVNVPSTGSVSYRGQAAHYDVAQDSVKRATSDFTVNFASKSLTGNINVSGQTDPIRLAAQFNTDDNSRFSGELNGVRVIGSFYGEGAAEMGGAYDKPTTTDPDVKEFTGGFGAKKQ